MHTALYYEQLVADASDIQRRTARRRHERPVRDHASRRPGRLRRSSAALLLRTAERLAKQPVAAIVPQPVSPRSGGAARGPAAG